MPNRQSLILIGMPGAGKSTLGVLLAKELRLGFLDTDVAIQVKEDRSLQDILEEDGYLALREVEEGVLLATNCHQMVVATGGSAVYSQKGMQYLTSCGPVVYLDVPLKELRRRIHNYETRGIARRPGQSFEDLYVERQALYRQYADITVVCVAMSPGDIIAEVVSRL